MNLRDYLQRFSGSCIAYKDDGTVCCAPAYYLDPLRPGLVCSKHRPQKKEAKKGLSK